MDLKYNKMEMLGNKSGDPEIFCIWKLKEVGRRVWKIMTVL